MELKDETEESVIETVVTEATVLTKRVELVTTILVTEGAVEENDVRG